MGNTKVTGDLIASSTIATGNIADNAVTSDKISGITTAHITEGSNLYYTDARARGAVSVSGNALSYNSSTGVITSNYEESPLFTGNVGSGVTPESWGTNGDTKAIQISTMTSLSEAFDGTQLASNFYFDGTNDKYIQSDFATSYLQIDGTHRWRYAASGTADANITWGEAMRIDSSGNVGIGTTSPTHQMHIHTDNDNTYALRVEGSTNNGAGVWTGIGIAGEGTNTKSAIIFEDIGVSYARGKLLFCVNNEQNQNSASPSDARMTIANDGNVGIGTTSPTSKLHLRDPGANSDVGIKIGNDSRDWNLKVMGSVSDSFQIFTHDNSNVMTILPSGNVGIGITNPLAKLQITSGDSGASSPWSNADELVLESSGNAGLAFQTPNTGAATIAFQDPESVQAGFIQYLHGDNAMRFATNGNNIRMLINSSGNVGIGTTSPSRKLVVAQSNVTEPSGVDANTGILIKNNTWSGIQIISTEATGGFITFGDNAAGFAGRIQYLHATNAMVFETAASERMRITSGGDITVSGGDLFLNSGTNYNDKGVVYISNERTAIISDIVNATANGDTSLDFQTRSGGARASSMFIDEFRRVGIGTDSPVNPLHVKAPNGGMMRIENSSGQIGAYTEFSGGYAYQYYYELGGGVKIALQTNGNSYFNGGNVGIGTTLPSTKLHVSHTTTIDDAYGLALVENTSTGTGSAANSALNIKSKYGTSQFMQWENQGLRIGSRIVANGAPGDVYFTAGSDSVKMVIKAGGNVGIGTTNNGSKLNVGGTIAAATNNGASGMIVPRSYAIDWGGATFTHTFDPVALFGQQFRGGQVLFECTGWLEAMNNGYIMWRNAGGSDFIGNGGTVQYVQTAYVSGGQSGSNTISVATNSGTNNITITFTGWHGNSHGFMCRITTNYS